MTSAWPFSQLANGTPIRDTGRDVEFRRNGKWISVRKLETPLDRVEILQEPTRALVAADLGEKKLTELEARNELRSLIVHTTAATDDADATLVPGDLEFSHGCIHILAQDRQKLVDKGFLRGGVKLRVQPYDPGRPARWGPPP